MTSISKADFAREHGLKASTVNMACKSGWLRRAGAVLPNGRLDSALALEALQRRSKAKSRNGSKKKKQPAREKATGVPAQDAVAREKAPNPQPPNPQEPDSSPMAFTMPQYGESERVRIFWQAQSEKRKALEAAGHLCEVDALRYVIGSMGRRLKQRLETMGKRVSPNDKELAAKITEDALETLELLRTEAKENRREALSKNANRRIGEFTID